LRTKSLFVTVAVLVVAFVVTLAGALRAQQPVQTALSGRVTSAAEGAMEGVLVSAKRAGSTIMVTVVTDAQGQYRFPASRLTPGSYALQTRAIGYDLAGPKTAVVGSSGPATADLRLVKTAHLEDQMSNGEWIASMPGTNEQKARLLDCTGCHTLQRVVDSYHNADDFYNNVLPRMENYSNQTFWLQPQPYRGARTGRGGFVTEEFAAYLASIDQSAGPRTWALRTFPRLKGASTHVIITQYDLPRRQIQPHDVIGTSDGLIWYSDFGQQFLGMLDPKTGKVTEFPVPEMKKGYLTGNLELEKDPNDNLWLANMYQGGISIFDPKARTFKQWQVQPAAHPDYTQESMVMPVHYTVDGKVWTNNQDDHSLRRLDVATGAWETFGPFFYAYGGNPKLNFNSYGIVSDSKNNVWLFDFPHSAIGHFDGKTFKSMPTPTAHSRPRRGRVDDRTGLFWFAEYGANQIGVYDTKLDDGTIKEFALPTPWDAPYDVVPDKNGEVWTAGMSTDRVSRLDPSTGKIVEWQLPTETNTRRVWVDNTKSSPTFWTGSNHGAAIVQLEALP
jgi:virginiamycin B lyase